MERPSRGAQKRGAEAGQEAPSKRQVTGRNGGSQAGNHAAGAAEDEEEQEQDMEDEEQEQGSFDDDEPQSTSEMQTPTRSTKRKSAARAAGSPGSMTSGCRYDSSLGMLTKKFLTLIDNSADGILDLNKAAETLKVQKRRIYDITNVLEGVGLIEKKSKNNIRWKGSSATADKEAEPESVRLKQDVLLLGEQERTLDEQIKVMGEAIKSMSDNPLNKDKLYMTDEDITRLPVFASDTIFAVKAPPGTTLEVPDPEEAAVVPGQRRYRILLKSSTGQIDVYLVQHTNNVGAATSQADGTAEEPQASTAGHGQAQAQPHQQAQPQAHGQAPLPQHQQHQHQGELPHGQLPPTVVKQEQGLLRQGIGAMSPFPLPFHLPPGVSPMANGASPFSANGAYPNFGVFNSPDLQNFIGSPNMRQMAEMDAVEWYNDGNGGSAVPLAQHFFEDDGPNMFDPEEHEALPWVR